jgi:hypothetical protein
MILSGRQQDKTRSMSSHSPRRVIHVKMTLEGRKEIDVQKMMKERWLALALVPELG